MPTVDYRSFVNRELPARERGCTSKVAYGSRREARAQRRRGRSGYVGLRPYRCRFCNAWHLGQRRRPP